MPKLQVTTIDSDIIWSKGDRSIWAVTLNYNGKTVKAKTYSEAIAKPGFEGEVEAYKKTGTRGEETFLKQVAKEGGYRGGFQRKPMASDYMMALSYAKDLVVAQVANGAKLSLDDSVAATIQYGLDLYESKPDGQPKVDVQKDAEDMRKALDEKFSTNTETIEEDDELWETNNLDNPLMRI